MDTIGGGSYGKKRTSTTTMGNYTVPRPYVMGAEDIGISSEVLGFESDMAYIPMCSSKVGLAERGSRRGRQARWSRWWAPTPFRRS